MYHLNSASVTDRGLNPSRPLNEDSLLEIPEIGIFAVADGVGGAEAGEVASQMAVEILAEAFTNARTGTAPASTMTAAIEQANAAIFELSSTIPQLERMATTIAAVHIGNENVTIAHVGDSRVYRLDHDGVLHRETEDHSFVNDEIRAGRMSADSAYTHPAKNIINRALGASGDVDIELKSIPANTCRNILLCTDGITAHVSESEIQEALSNAAPLDKICGHLKDLCFERGAKDNLTAIVITIGPPQDGDGALGEKTSQNISDDLAAHKDQHLSSSKIEIDLDKGMIDDRSEVAEFKDGLLFSDHYREAGDPRSLIFIPLIKTVGLLLLGAAVGIGAYTLGTRNVPAEASIPDLPEMTSENIPLTSFEKNRRNVDKDPVAFLREVPPAVDAEDHYLIGRARMLTGDLSGARQALLEAKKGLAEVDPANRITVEKEIFIALAIIESTSASERLQRELAQPRP